jgi:RES domain-containing protein
MPDVWRLIRPEYGDRLDGEGSKIAGGRWNSIGRNAVYTSPHLSLAVLETYVNIPQELRDDLPVLSAVRIAVPDDAGAAKVSEGQFADLIALPDPLAASRLAVDDWLDRGDALVLEVPSVLVPEETNLILNPAHPRMREVKISSTRAFHFDPRLVMRKGWRPMPYAARVRPTA